MGGRWRWVIGGLLFASTVINYIDRQTLSVLGPHLKTEFHWSNQDFALIVIAFRVAYAVMQTVSGRLVDRLGTRNGLSLAVVVVLRGRDADLVSRAASRASAASASCWARAKRRTGPRRPRPCPSGSRGASGAGRSPCSTAAPRSAPPSPRPSCSSSSATSATGGGPSCITGCLGFLWLMAWRRLYHPPETPPLRERGERRMILEDRAAEQATTCRARERAPPPTLRAPSRPCPRPGARSRAGPSPIPSGS